MTSRALAQAMPMIPHNTLFVKPPPR